MKKPFCDEFDNEFAKYPALEGVEGEIRSAIRDLYSQAKKNALQNLELEPTEKIPCDRCDSCGGSETYANQVSMPLNGKVVCIDWCIHRIVAALNAAGIKTDWCCCGHGERNGIIQLVDGRRLLIKQDN